MRTFKRDNWTNEQVINFINGQKIIRGDGIECDYCKKHNVVVDDVISFVKDTGRCNDYAWTNDEVFNLLGSLQLKEDSDYAARYNGTINDIICYFYDFTIPVEEFGAMGYCVEEDMVCHIGAIPDEMSEQWKKDHIEL